MGKLKKRTPMKVPDDMHRAIQQIYDDINEHPCCVGFDRFIYIYIYIYINQFKFIRLSQ